MNKTQRLVMDVAKELFTEKEIEQVTVREIAERAGISHTTIYLYFKNKQELVSAVSVEPLTELHNILVAIYGSQKTKSEKLLAVCHEYVSFGLKQRGIYALVASYQGERVDLAEYSSPISQLRMQSFSILRDLIFAFLPDNADENKKINILRGSFFFLHGLIVTYSSTAEVEAERIQGIVRDFIEYTIISRDN